MFNARNSGPLYLPGVEAHHQPGPYQKLVADAKSRGAEYSKIWDLFAFKNEFTVHLARLSQGVMRLPATISPGLRELIAAYTSYQNECAFCTQAHAAAAAELLQDESLVWKVLRDVETSRISDKEKLLLRFVGKVTKNLPAVTATMSRRCGRRAGTTRRSTTRSRPARLFNFYNRWITATGVPEMSAEAHRQQGSRSPRAATSRETADC